MTPPEQLRLLLDDPGFLVMPDIWDGLTARMTFEAGFKTAFLSGSCVAAGRFAGPDLDLLSLPEVLDSLGQVRSAAPDLLVFADADHGYGNPINVQRTVRALGRAGAAAVLIEDKISPRPLSAIGKPTLPREEAVQRMRAAVEAARDSGIMVLARTDCRPSLGIAEAVARIECFAEAGADILFLDSPATEAEAVQAIAAAGDLPSFIVLSPDTSLPFLTRSRATELGYKLGTCKTGLLAPVIAALEAGLQALRAGELEPELGVSTDRMREVLGYKTYQKDSERFVKR